MKAAIGILSLVMILTVTLGSGGATRAARTGPVGGGQTGPQDADFLLLGSAELDGKLANELTVCAEGGDWQPPGRTMFKAWLDHIGDIAVHRNFASGKCQLISLDKRYHQGPIEEVAAGLATFRVADGKLAAVQKYPAGEVFFVVPSAYVRPDLELRLLSGCAAGATADRLRSKLRSLFRYATVAERVSRVGTTCDAAVLTGPEYADLKRKGIPKGNGVLKLSGERLEPVK